MKRLMVQAVAVFIIITGYWFVPTFGADSSGETLSPEAFMEKYRLAESLELGIQPVFSVANSDKIANVEWYNLTLTHMINRDTGLRLSTGYLSFNAVGVSYQPIYLGSSVRNFQDVNIGRLRQWTFRATLTQNLATGADINPYIGAGINFYRNFDALSLLGQQTMWVRTSHNWGGHFATGLRYLTERSLSLSLDIYRDWWSNDMLVSRAESGPGLDTSGRLPTTTLDLGLWSVGLNISLRF